MPVKPLLSTNAANSLLERTLNAEGAMLRALTPTSPTSASLQLSVQDKQRGFDWIDIIFEMDGISDARFVDNAALRMLDTDEGISIVFEEGTWGIGIGRYRNLASLKDAPLFCTSQSLKYAEAAFSG